MVGLWHWVSHIYQCGPDILSKYTFLLPLNSLGSGKLGGLPDLRVGWFRRSNGRRGVGFHHITILPAGGPGWAAKNGSIYLALTEMIRVIWRHLDCIWRTERSEGLFLNYWIFKYLKILFFLRCFLLPPSCYKMKKVCSCTGSVHTWFRSCVGCSKSSWVALVAAIAAIAGCSP